MLARSRDEKEQIERVSVWNLTKFPVEFDGKGMGKIRNQAYSIHLFNKYMWAVSLS